MFVMSVWELFLNPHKSVSDRKEGMRLYKMYQYELFTGKNDDWKLASKLRLKDLCYYIGGQTGNMTLDKRSLC